MPPRRRDEDEIPTPRQTGSWAVSIGRCQALITRLSLARVQFLSANPTMRDPERGEICARHVNRLREMVERFERWPTAPREEVDLERAELLGELNDLTRATDALCARLGRSY